MMHLTPLATCLAISVTLCSCSDDATGGADTADTGNPTDGSGMSTAPGSGSDSSSSAGSASSEGSTTAVDTTGAPDPCATVLGSGADSIFTRREGNFVLFQVPGYTSLSGTAAPVPRPDFHSEADRDGLCRLLTFESSICTPDCIPPEVCIEGACVREELLVSVGDVTLSGVGDQTVDVPESDIHTYLWQTESAPTLSMPRIAGEGAGEFAAFDLSVCPVTAATPESDWAVLLAERAPGESVMLTWSDPIDTARIYLRMTTGIGTHGGISPVEVECEGPDLGQLELPGAFLDALYAQGWSCGECGGNELIRYHADESQGEGPVVQLRATATTNFWFIP